jgi:hypothetical protein
MSFDVISRILESSFLFSPPASGFPDVGLFFSVTGDRHGVGRTGPGVRLWRTPGTRRPDVGRALVSREYSRHGVLAAESWRG